MTRKGLAVLAAGAIAVAMSTTAMAKEWFPFPVQIWDGFDFAGPHKDGEYTPLDKASKPWNICVSFPHMKDAYWLASTTAWSQEAKRHGVKMKLVEAGGYTELNKQISQIEDCVASRRAGASSSAPSRSTA